jgi:ABC-type Fe3+/spermidine/putrescine transport system ATPase subunit
MGPVLQLQRLTKRFDQVSALVSVSLDVEPGSFFALLGPSGCGKTTTLRLIAGFEEPTSGDVLLNGRSLLRLPPYARNISTVFQSYALFPHLTVDGNIGFGLRQKRVPEAEARRRVAEVTDLLELEGKGRRYPHQLSGGERQRVALARSLVLHPEVLLLDEPLSALDPSLRRQVRSELRALQRRVGVTFIFVTHDQEEALSLADRIALFRSGRVEQVGTPREVYERPVSRFAAGFMGAVNWLEGFGVRPEDVRIARQAPDGDSRSLRGTVRGATFLGNLLHVETEVDGGRRVVAELGERDAGFEAGEPVQVWWRPQDELHLPEEAV